MTIEGDEGSLSGRLQTPRKIFDARLLNEPLKTLPSRPPVVVSPTDSVTVAVRVMQRESRGCVLVTADGTARSNLLGIFSDRDVLHRIVGRGKDPVLLPVAEVMTPEPESLPVEATIAWVLNKMAIGGFRHVPVVNALNHPQFVVSVRDVVDFLVEFFPREILGLPPLPDAARRAGG